MSVTHDHFNYPSLNRKDLMSLSTISAADERLKRFKGGLETKRDYSYNLFNIDLEKSSPKTFGVLHNKVSFINKTDDIDRSFPKLLHMQINKPEFNLSNKDIQGSSPKSQFWTTRKPFNPLEPNYNLSQVENVPLPEPKFIRDNIQINDIEGTHPKKFIVWNKRDMMNIKDIEGTSTKRAKLRTASYSNMNYSDVTHDKFKTKRCVNPLNPMYEIKYKEGTVVHGKIEKSEPCGTLPYKYPIYFKLELNDIPEAQPGSLNKVKNLKSNDGSLKIGDVPGAQPSTLRRGITTIRQTNPLNPQYNLLGAKELLNENNNPYGTTYNLKNRKTDNRVKEHRTNEDQRNGQNELEKYISETNKSPLYEENHVNNYENVNDNYAGDNKRFAENENDPYYGYFNDKFVKNSDLNNKKTIIKDTLSSKSHNRSKSIGTNFNKTSGNFSYKSTFAQKLDNFISNQ